jgi:tetratricopeptide (TPR) repeat protein
MCNFCLAVSPACLLVDIVNSTGPVSRYCLGPFLFLFLGIVVTSAASSQPVPQKSAKPPQSQSQGAPTTSKQVGQLSPYEELQERLQKQHDAIQAGNPSAIEAASRSVVSFALRGMAQIRNLEAAWPQAVELYHQSLALEDDTPTRLALASVCISADKYDEGLIEVNKVLATEPRSAEAWDVKGKILMAKEDYKGAAAAMARSLELHRDPNAQLLLALAYLNLKDKPKAEAVFRQMLQDYDDRAIWHVIFGGAYRETGYQFEAVAEFRKALALDPTVPHVHYFIGLTLMEISNNGSTPEIMHEYEEEVRRYPDDFFGNYGLGGLEARDGYFEQSNKHLLAASKADPSNPDPYIYLGLNAFRQRDNATAETYLRQAVVLTGDNVSRNDYNIRRGYIALARILSSEGKKEEAQVYFDKAKAASDSEHRSHEETMSSYLTSKEDTGPAVVYSKPSPKPQVPSAEPAQVDFTADIGTVQLENTRLTPAQLEEAEKRVKSLRAILGNSYNDWGTSEARRGQYGMALSHFQDAEKWDDTTPGLMRNIGLAALKLGNNEEAARAFRVAVDKDPNDASARAMLAISLYSSQKYAEAAKAFAQVGDAVYRDPRMTYAYAFSLARVNDPQKTVEVLNKLTAQPLPKEMWMTAGDVYTRVDDYEDALRCFRKAIELDPNMDRAHHFAGVALIRLGRPSEAIPELQAELKLSPNDPDTQYNLAYAMLETSQKDQAMAILESLTMAHPDHAQAQYELGKELLNSGDKNEAIQHLEAAARLEPNTDYVHYQLQAAYRKAGRTSDADKEMQVYREIKAQQREKGTPQPKQQ